MGIEGSQAEWMFQQHPVPPATLTGRLLGTAVAVKIQHPSFGGRMNQGPRGTLIINTLTVFERLRTVRLTVEATPCTGLAMQAGGAAVGGEIPDEADVDGSSEGGPGVGGTRTGQGWSQKDRRKEDPCGRETEHSVCRGGDHSYFTFHPSWKRRRSPAF